MQFFECDRVPVRIENIRYGTPRGDDLMVHIPRERGLIEVFYKFPGDSTFIIDGVTKHLTEGTVGYLPPLADSHRYYDIIYKNDSASINLFLRCDDIGAFPDTAQFFPCGKIPGIEKLFENLNHVWNVREVGYYGEAVSLWYRLLTKMRRNNAAEYCSPSQYRMISEAADYMNEHFLEPDFDIYSLADRSGISRSYFKKIFCRKFGTSPKQYIIARRMNYARDLLLDGIGSITEVSEAAGYSNICYFSQAFKRFWGSSPQNYIDDYKTQHEAVSTVYKTVALTKPIKPKN